MLFLFVIPLVAVAFGMFAGAIPLCVRPLRRLAPFASLVPILGGMGLGLGWLGVGWLLEYPLHGTVKPEVAASIAFYLGLLGGVAGVVAGFLAALWLLVRRHAPTTAH